MTDFDPRTLDDRQLLLYLAFGDLPRRGWAGRRCAIARRLALLTLIAVLVVIALVLFRDVVLFAWASSL